MQDQITIIGYEENAIAARNSIMKILRKFEKTVTKQIPLNHRVYGHIIGFNGKSIPKINNQFQVVIHFPPKGASDPNIVTVTGLPDKVTKAIDHILSLEKHYLAVIKRIESQKKHIQKVTLCNLTYASFNSSAVKDVPCAANNTQQIPYRNSSEDFPSLEDQVDPKIHSWRYKK